MELCRDKQGNLSLNIKMSFFLVVWMVTLKTKVLYTVEDRWRLFESTARKKCYDCNDITEKK